MFERFTDRARRVVVLAQEDARLLNHNYVGTEHVLLGLLHEGEGIAAKVLESERLALGGLRRQVEETIGRGESTPSGHIPFTPRAKKVLELSLREALELGHNYIGTEHLLLGLLREGEGVAGQVLATNGVDINRVRRKVNEALSGGGVPLEAQPAPSGRPSVFEMGVAQGVSGEAARRGHEEPGSEHVLLWLLTLSGSGVVRALEAEGVDLDALRARLEQLLEEGDGSTDAA
ncbi:MAG: Clp protease N-terminal domain-containing protein [Acidimicrobiales bacterium]